MNFSGIIIAIVTALLIWFGHIWVVKLYNWSGTKLWFIPLIIGVALVVISLVIENIIISSSTAIGAITFFWGIKELFEYKEKHIHQQ